VDVSLVEAATRGYDCVLLTDCTATQSPKFCWDATLYNVGLVHGLLATSRALTEAIAHADDASGARR
jgi:nicotinamidase-related amidase